MFTIIQDIAIGVVCIIFIFCMFIWILNLCWLFTKLTPLKKFCHDILDWHKPEKNQFASSRKTVICVIDNTHYKLLDNCMLYTMLTRAKKRCLLCAEPQAFYKCLNTSNNARNTWLSTIKRKV